MSCSHAYPIRGFNRWPSTVFWRPTPCLFRASFWQYSNGFYSLDSLIGYKYLFHMHAWKVVSISDHLRIFDILLRVCSVLQLHLFIYFFLKYSINGYLISYKYFFLNRWTSDYLRICDVPFCACAIRLLHLEYQRLKLISLFMTSAHDRSVILMLYATYIFCNCIIIKTDQIIYVILFLISTRFMVSFKWENTKKQ